MESVAILAVGGTIDAEEYDFSEGRVLRFGEPAVRAVLKRLRPWMNVHEAISAFPQKDSSEMTVEDRSRIAAFCRNTPAKRILITHGTDTMILTGLALEQIANKTIVLTGALPYCLDPVHAAFNIGSALAACQLLSPGVYIAMSGEVVPVREAVKMRSGNVIIFTKKLL